MSQIQPNIHGERIFSNSNIDLSGGTINALNIYSGGTELSLLIGGGGTQTYIQLGSNITTGGTNNAPTINLIASPSINSITASGASSFTTLSANTIVSGATPLQTIIQNIISSAINLTGSAFVNFGFSGANEGDFATTFISDSRINGDSNVLFKFYPSNDHLSFEDFLLDDISVTFNDITGGTGFYVSAYAKNNSWGIYNFNYKIIN